MFASEEIRRAFPTLDGCVYLNTASAGLSWAGQGAAAAEFYDVAKAKGIGGSDQWAAKAEGVRELLGRLLRVSDERVHFAGSTTEALNLIAMALPLGQGDCVLVADDEFPSVIHPWQALESRGVKLRRVQVTSEPERTHLLCEAIDSRTRVLAISHVHWRTGTRVDLDALSAACRRQGCRLIVDGVQALGAIAVDAGGVDAYCASVFKWLLSGFGLAVFVLSEPLARELTPMVRGYANPVPSRALRYGHLNYPGLYALHATLRYLDSIGWPAIYDHVARLATRTRQGLRERGFDVVTPEHSHAGIVSMRHAEAARLVASLESASILVEDGSPYLRVSPHFYNSDADLDRLLDTLVKIA